MFENIPNQSTKFRTRNWIKINDESRAAYNNNYNSNNTKFKLSMIRSNLCDYSDAYIFVKGTTSVPNTAAQGAAENNINNQLIFKKCALSAQSVLIA